MMKSNPGIEPQAYFITFTCYGTWLHGDVRGSIDRHQQNTMQTPPLSPDAEREQYEFRLLKHSPVLLGSSQRLSVQRAIEDVCCHRGWKLHALNVRSNHVHAVVTANRSGLQVITDFKSYATRPLKESGCLPESCLEVIGESSDRLTPSPTIPYRGRQGAAPSREKQQFRVWMRGGSARPITTEDALVRAIHYTLHEQGRNFTTDDSKEGSPNGESELEPRP